MTGSTSSSSVPPGPSAGSAITRSDAPDRALAAWASTVGTADVPPATLDWARLILLDAIANALTGRLAEERSAVVSVADAIAGPGGTTTMAGSRRSVAGATFVNAFQITGATVCDVHRPTLCHVTPEVVPAVLAAAQHAGATGHELVTALAVGLESAVRVASAFDGPGFRSRGWHAPGIAGPFGAAAAAGRLLGLDEVAMGHAFGHAGGQAAGTFAALGTSAVKFHQARGAVSGVLAAFLAADHLDAADDVLTNQLGGLLAAYGDGGRPEALTADLGVTWRCHELSLRRWPGASSVQALIEAALTIAGDLGDDRPADVHVGLPTRSYELSGQGGWADQLGALQSARYVASVVLHDRACWLEQYDRDHRADPRIDAFARDHVEVAADTALPPSGAAITVTTASGRTFDAQVDVPFGAPERPLAWGDVRHKLAIATGGIGRPGHDDAIATCVAGLDDEATVTALMDLLDGPRRETDR